MAGITVVDPEDSEGGNCILGALVINNFGASLEVAVYAH